MYNYPLNTGGPSSADPAWRADTAAPPGAGTPPSESDLPSEWARAYDEASRETYYVHTPSGHEQQERPFPLLPGWRHAIHAHGDRKGELYYYNTITREIREADRRPEDSAAASPASSMADLRLALPPTTIQPNRTTNPRGSWPCERMAAHIQSSAQDSIRNNDVEDVCIRFLQTKGKQRIFANTATLEAIYTLTHLYMAWASNGTGSRVFHGTNAAVGMGFMLPHVGVSLQMRSIQDECREYLANRFGQDFLNDLDGLQMDKKGLDTVIALLTARNPEVSTLKLEEKLKEVIQKEAPGTRWPSRLIHQVYDMAS